MGVMINNKYEGSMEHNIISVSGGKDSTALLLLAIERNTENMQAVFADTGNEHQQTYDYVQYLHENVFPIRRVVADFSKQIAGKREYVLEKWAEKGVSQADIDRAAPRLLASFTAFSHMRIRSIASGNRRLISSSSSLRQLMHGIQPTRPMPCEYSGFFLTPCLSCMAKTSVAVQSRIGR